MPNWNVRVFNNSGVGRDTKILVDGTEVRGVRAIKIDEITPDKPITAYLVVYLAELDVVMTDDGINLEDE